jgi:methyl-accepting chemotaxis protein
MFFSKKNDTQAELEALNRSHAVIRFTPDGIILDANENFLSAIGYALDEISGKHHRMFCDPEYAQSDDYKKFWARLAAGEFFSAHYKRFAKGGREIWIEASYNPIFDKKGKVVSVVKYATDITARQLRFADYEGQMAAISRAQAVIQFNMDGTIITANENFCAAMGYSLDEIKGRHHSIFASPEFAKSDDYKKFWQRLNAGEHFVAEYQRFAKGGREIWIQASYNPIFDMNGNPFKVVKYATDITAQKLTAADARGQLEAISKAQAVIEFNLDGTIITDNRNFLDAVGYTLDEIKGKHHRMFVDPVEAA